MADPRRAAAVHPSNMGGVAPSAQPKSTSVPLRRTMLPERYAEREKEGSRFLVCDEAPRLRVVIDPKMSVSRSAAIALGERVILLDGAGNFGPLMDNERKLYNLDHHVGCERLFTLSTCEQTLLLVQSGLELSEGDWTVYANDPDLDTVLALWCLLNYRRVRELSPQARDVLLPLFRLEGAIDANGPELASMCGLSTVLLEQTQKTIESLLARERALKQAGSWTKKKFYPYTIEMLRALDGLVYAREDFGDYTSIDEIYGHVEVGNRRVAVACRDGAGIYTVEQHLKSRWGDQLSFIALENEPGQYTLRRVNLLAGPQLGPAYELLNRVDAAVDGRPASKQWGGSHDIGGSPRPHGTRLAPEEVLEILARAYRPSTWWTRARRTTGALLVGVASLIFWPLGALLPTVASFVGVPAGVTTAYRVALSALLMLGVGLLAMRFVSRRRPWVFGWRAPANGGGWWLAPLAMLGALPGAAFVAAWTDVGSPAFVAIASAAVFAVAAGEVWFRGLVHGLLAHDFPVQRPRGRWLLSRAALTSAVAYTMVAVVFTDRTLLGSLVTPYPANGIEIFAVTATISFVAGLALAVLRERSLSLVPGLALQAAGVAAAAALLGAAAL